jgi:predicted metal-dependent hydrolase
MRIDMSTIPPYEIERSNRRSISLQISHNGELIVKAPYLVPAFVVREFVKNKSAWVAKQMGLVTKFHKKSEGIIAEGDEYPFLGNTYTLHAGSFKAIHVAKTLNIPTVLMFRAKKELVSWYTAQAKQIITESVKRNAVLMKTSYKSITYSDTTSKWGSCSHDNSLQFNWRLVMAPLNIIEYVVIHELAHTKEKNHRRGFWDIVSTYKPAYKQYVKWLKVNSHKLHSILHE